MVLKSNHFDHKIDPASIPESVRHTDVKNKLRIKRTILEADSREFLSLPPVWSRMMVLTGYVVLKKASLKE